MVLNTALPFFALILCGYGAGRFELLSRESIAGVNAFVFYFALPVFLFDLMATSPLGETLNFSFMAAYLSAGLFVFATAAILGKFLLGVHPGEAVIMGSAAVLGNTGYMGLPLVSAAFGERAAIPLVLGLTLEVTIIIPLTIVLIEAGQGVARGQKSLASPVVKALVRNPLIAAIFAGALFSATDFSLPTPIGNFTDLLGGTAGPCALFALGATLTERAATSGLGEVSYMTYFKLFVHPVVMWFAVTRLFDVSPLWANVAILGASLPVAANVFIIAKQYDLYVARISSAILVSTAISVLTVSTLLTVLLR